MALCLFPLWEVVVTEAEACAAGGELGRAIQRVTWGLHDGDVGPGTWKTGRWMPIQIHFSEIAAGSENVEAEHVQAAKKVRCIIADCDGVNAVYERDLPRVLPEKLELCVQAGNIRGGFTLEVLDAEGGVRQRMEFAEPGTPLDDAREIVLVVGGSTAGMELAVEHLEVPGRLRPLVKRLPSAEFLPADVRALETVGTILVMTQDDAVLESWTPSRVDVLEAWMRRGGMLLVCAGKNGVKMAENGACWGRFLPAEEKSLRVSMPQTAAMEHFAQSAVPVPLLGVTQEYRMPVTRVAWTGPGPRMAETRVLFSQYDLPLAVRSGCDFGRFVCLMFDLEHESLAKWGDRGKLLARLLDFPQQTGKYAGSESANHAYHTGGYDDLSGQLRSALDQFPQVKTFSFVSMIFVFLVYLAIIGPGGFYLMRELRRGDAQGVRALSQTVLAWGFFLVAVGFFCGLCYYFSLTPGADVRMNRAVVVDVSQATGSVRQTLWGNFWTADTGRISLDFPDTPRSTATTAFIYPQDTSLRCLGLPGAFLGGMASKMQFAGRESADSDYRYAVRDGRWRGVPLVARSTKSVEAQHFFALRPDETPFFGTVEDRGNIPYGTVRNPLDTPLSHCMLAYGGWAYDLGTLAPGEEVTIDDRIRRYDLASMLVESEMVEDEESPVKTTKNLRRVTYPYDRGSHDLAYILRAMMFHGATGGKSYTGMNHAYNGWMDCTPSLRSGMAVLCGTVDVGHENALFPDIRVMESASGKPINVGGDENRNVRILRAFIPVGVTPR